MQLKLLIIMASVVVHMPARLGGARGDIQNPVYTIQIPNHLLYTWYSDNSGYIKKMNENLASENSIQVRKTAVRVEGRLRWRAAEVIREGGSHSLFRDDTGFLGFGRFQVSETAIKQT